MTEAKTREKHGRELSGISVPLMWPMLAAEEIAEQELGLYARNLKFLARDRQPSSPRHSNLVLGMDRSASSIRTDLISDGTRLPPRLEKPGRGVALSQIKGARAARV